MVAEAAVAAERAGSSLLDLRQWQTVKIRGVHMEVSHDPLLQDASCQHNDFL